MFRTLPRGCAASAGWMRMAVAVAVALVTVGKPSGSGSCEMEGHRAIIKARKKGYKPRSIFFEVDLLRTPVNFDFEAPERALETNQHARVLMALSEPWRTYNMRFVAATVVHLHGPSMSDELVWFGEKLGDSGADKVIIACEGGCRELMEYVNGIWNADV
jgi:hypothetical protein